MAMLIFMQKINMDGHADFFVEKSTWMAMLIFFQKINMDGHADFPQKINMDGHADFSLKNKHGWPC